MSLTADFTADRGGFVIDAELSIAPGELVALLGPNGSGKSTVLRCLMGLHPIAVGSIVLDGTVLDDPAIDVCVPPERRPIGVVFQDYLLFPTMSVIENVAFALRAAGRSKQDARSAAATWLARVALSEYAHRRPAELSGGQAQRAALARALIAGPRLLLLDEPLAALDAGTRAQVRRDLRQALATFEGMRLMVTHDPVDAYALADRVVVMEAGRVVQSGTIHDVTAHPKSRYIAQLIGVNLINGTIADSVFTTTTGGRLEIADAAPGPAFAVVHPNSITLTLEAPSASSTRNVVPGVITTIDQLGDRVRVGVDGAIQLIAEITPAARHSLGLRPGDLVHTAIKATDIEAYPA